MDIPYSTIFVGLLLAYMVYSVWARLDGRFPIVAALVLLVVTAVVDAAGDTNAANSLAEYVFFLLAAGVVLLLVEHVRERGKSPAAADSGGPSPESVSSQPADEGKRPSEKTFHGLEEKTVPVVDRTGDDHENEEESRDREPEHGQAPEGEGRVEDAEENPHG